jgi:threonine dehydratase
MDVITLASLVQHGLINRDRVFTFSVLLPDKPGQLLNVAQVVAAERGNIIKLEHNHFVSINRNEAVELLVTLEAFGTSHKEKIMESLRKAGYSPTIYDPAERRQTTSRKEIQI